MEFLEQRTEEINKLLTNLKELNEKINLESGSRPPIWNENVSDISQYIENLIEWIDRPKLTEIKKIIYDLKKISKDIRDFNIDNFSSYYLNIYDNIIEVKNIINKINPKIKEKITLLILDTIIRQIDKSTLNEYILSIENVINKINTEIFGLDDGENKFLNLVKEEIKNDIINSISEDFEELISLISIKKQTFLKASNLLKLAPRLTEQVLINEYNKTKDIDNLWNKCDNLRTLIDQIKIINLHDLKESRNEIIKKIEDLLNEKEEVFNLNDLSDIIEKLEHLKNKLQEKMNELKNLFNEITLKLHLWSKALNNPKFNSGHDKLERCNNLIERIDNLKVDIIDNLNEIDFKELINNLDEYNKFKVEIEDFFKKNISENAKIILENLNNLDIIKRELGKDFYISIKEITEIFENLKIKLEWVS